MDTTTGRSGARLLDAARVTPAAPALRRCQLALALVVAVAMATWWR